MANAERDVAMAGAGLIGRAWAAIFARAGWNVRLTDPDIPTLQAAPRLIRNELHLLARHGLADDPDGAVARISAAGSFEAPGGIPDYCARYTGFYRELAASAAGPAVYERPNVDQVIAHGRGGRAHRHIDGTAQRAPRHPQDQANQ